MSSERFQSGVGFPADQLRQTHVLLSTGWFRPGRLWVLDYLARNRTVGADQVSDAAVYPSELIELAFSIFHLAWRATKARAKVRLRAQSYRLGKLIFRQTLQF